MEIASTEAVLSLILPLPVGEKGITVTLWHTCLRSVLCKVWASTGCTPRTVSEGLIQEQHADGRIDSPRSLLPGDLCHTGAL